MLVCKQDKSTGNLDLEEEMESERFAITYWGIVFTTTSIAVIYLIAVIRKSGGKKQYFENRGIGKRHNLEIAWSIFNIVVMTWVFTPVTTYFCRDIWLHNRHQP